MLPTGGAARQRGGLSVTDYLKVISVQQLSASALRRLVRRRSRRWRAPRASRRHARSVEVPRFGETVSGKAAKFPRGAIRPRPAVIAMAPYSPPTGGRAGKLRLDFNENTVGCSPRVIEAIRQRRGSRGSRGLSGIRRGQERDRELFPGSAGAIRFYQRHRRGHSGFHQHLRG